MEKQKLPCDPIINKVRQNNTDHEFVTFIITSTKEILWGCSTGAVMLVTIDFSRVGSNFYRVG